MVLFSSFSDRLTWSADQILIDVLAPNRIMIITHAYTDRGDVSSSGEELALVGNSHQIPNSSSVSGLTPDEWEGIENKSETIFKFGHHVFLKFELAIVYRFERRPLISSTFHIALVSINYDQSRALSSSNAIHKCVWQIVAKATYCIVSFLKLQSLEKKSWAFPFLEFSFLAAH